VSETAILVTVVRLKKPCFSQKIVMNTYSNKILAKMTPDVRVGARTRRSSVPTWILGHKMS
jgi:hypothetical protein